ncbi:hypothetical protein P879_09811 [Paragonimus westermani]|uniref:Reverse transcriptase/retrotransposon-derived protein RNase H-like domain-containing protein n=1 Tax=Paragonimus westermani TaxID=34504 RepID=A0A8T0DAA7_9TREM|nr:hypothetical protein P879_11828 [Paragonimus westermani]KAF8564783.1 hypothetical protein P879_09811 [Paragonimus westermani]
MTFIIVREALTSIVVLYYQQPNVRSTIATDESGIVKGAVLRQAIIDAGQSVSFSQHLSENEMRHKFGCQLLNMYGVLEYFHQTLRGRDFIVSWSHQTPVCDLRNYSDRYPRWGTRQLGYVVQFSTDVHHVPGVADVAADTLLRVHSVFGTTDPNSHRSMAAS